MRAGSSEKHRGYDDDETAVGLDREVAMQIDSVKTSCTSLAIYPSLHLRMESFIHSHSSVSTTLQLKFTFLHLLTFDFPNKIHQQWIRQSE